MPPKLKTTLLTLILSLSLLIPRVAVHAQQDAKALLALLKEADEARKRGDYPAELAARQKLYDNDIKTDLKEAAGDLCDIGICYEHMSKHQEAIKYFVDSAVIDHRVHEEQDEVVVVGLIQRIADRLSKPLAALDPYCAALADARSHGDRDTEAWLLEKIGQIYLHAEQHQEAIGHYNQALAIVTDIGDKARQAIVLNLLGNAYSSTFKRITALTYYERAFKLDKELGLEMEMTMVLNNMGRQYRFMGQYAQAMDCFNQASDHAKQSENKFNAPLVLSNIAELYSLQGKFEQAVDCYNKAISIYRDLGATDPLADTLLNRGLTLNKQSKSDEAEEDFQNALTIYRRVGSKVEEAVALVSIGENYGALNQFAKALRYDSEALSLAREMDDHVGEAVLLNDIGLVYEKLRQHDKALDYLNQALRRLTGLDNKVLEAKVLGSIGAIEGQLGRDSEALDHFNKSLPIYDGLGDPHGQVLAITNISDTYVSLKNYAKALDYLNHGLTIAEDSSDRRGEVMILGNIGCIYALQGDLQKAITYDQKALAIQPEVEDRITESLILFNLADAYSSLHLNFLAVFFHKQSVNVLQSIRRDNTDLSQDLQRGFLNANANAYRRLSELLIEQGRIPEAQVVLRMLKDDEFLDFVRRDAAQSGGEKLQVALNPVEGDWQKRYDAVADKVTAIGETRAVLLQKQRQAAKGDGTFSEADKKKLTQTEADLQVANKAFQSFLDKLQNEADALQKKGAKVNVTAQAIQDTAGVSELLTPGAVALYTIVEPDKYRIIVVTGQTQKAEEYTISSAELNKKIFAFRDALQNPGLDPRPLGKALYDILIAPAQKDLDGANAHTLLWSLDGPLRYIPVAALYDGKQYLVERYANVEFTGASLPRLGLADEGKWTGLGLGVTQAHTLKDGITGETMTFAALGGVANELSEVISGKDNTTGAIPGTTALDTAFTRASLMASLDASHPQVVHIASHFAFRPGRDEDSFLLLGDGSELTLSDIKTMPHVFSGVDLLTLSACDTAMGDTSADGREVEGLGIIAQRQGAHAVMASLWPVSDVSTPQFMKDFYASHQATGQVSKADALRQSQLDMLHGKVATAQAVVTDRGTARAKGDTAAPAFVRDAKAPYAHPYYWAPFILIGNWK